MSQDETNPPESGTIESVRKWLSKQGYTLEMVVARAFHARDADVQQSDFYQTPDKVFREIDVSARFKKLWKVGSYDAGEQDIEVMPDEGAPEGFDPIRMPQFLFFDLFVVAECKRSPKAAKPWVVFTSTRNRMPSMTRFQRVGSEIGRHVLENYLSTRADVANLSIFDLPQRVGYGLAVAHVAKDDDDKDKADRAYAALTGLVSAATARAEPDVGNIVIRAARIVLPVLVVDVPIVECWLDDDNSVQLRECDHLKIVWRNPVVRDPREGHAHTVIEVIHENAIDRYVGEVRAAFDVMVKYTDEVERSMHDVDALQSTDLGDDEL